MSERTGLHGKDFLDWLERGGIIPGQTRRVVIDASVNQQTIIYVEGLASPAMIEVDPPAELRGAVVRMAEPPVINNITNHYGAADEVAQ